MRSHPEVLWAQRSDKVYLAIALTNAKDITVKCEPNGSFNFSAVGSKDESFELSLELYGKIVPEVSICSKDLVCLIDIGRPNESNYFFLSANLLFRDYETRNILVIASTHIPKKSCKTQMGLRNILCTVLKEEKGWWKRLLKSEEKPPPYIKVDWNRWCDEDEESDNDDLKYASDDDGSSGDDGMLYLPDLEKVRGT